MRSGLLSQSLPGWMMTLHMLLNTSGPQSLPLKSRVNNILFGSEDLLKSLTVQEL